MQCHRLLEGCPSKQLSDKELYSLKIKFLQEEETI